MARRKQRHLLRKAVGLIITAISGLVLIAMGVLLLTGELTRLNLDAQNALDSLGINVFKNL